jgi:hypothetical protein
MKEGRISTAIFLNTAALEVPLLAPLHTHIKVEGKKKKNVKCESGMKRSAIGQIYSLLEKVPTSGHPMPLFPITSIFNRGAEIEMYGYVFSHPRVFSCSVLTFTAWQENQEYKLGK